MRGASLPPPALAREASLVPGETYFFRDHGQFDLLRFKLLPEFIAARSRRRTLRIWSAGCATGEEAYTLAMVVDMALPDRRSWQVSILGTDLNCEFLDKARRGRYREWSFRRVPEVLRQRYFRRDGDESVLRDDIRSMVTFRPGNLLTDPLPDAAIRDMDLILCRNVLIYLQPDGLEAVAGKLAACLAEGGYLMTAHTELMGIPAPGLAPRLHAEGVVYQKSPPARATPAPTIPAAIPPTPTAPAARSPARLGTRPAPDTQPAAPPLAAARTLADRGDYEGAEMACRAALSADPVAPAPHFLLAQLAQLRGDYREAEEQLNRTLYLAPGDVAACLELAALHERTGQGERAVARRRAALDLLRRLPPDAQVEPFETSAGQLAAWLSATEDL